MAFQKRNLKQDELLIPGAAGFWKWFERHEQQFFDIVYQDEEVAPGFLDVLSPVVNEVIPGTAFLTGMTEGGQAELIFSADGDIRLIPFIEDLVAMAPALKRWRFTALKPALNLRDVDIRMVDLRFAADNIWFSPITNPGFPDEINLAFIHEDYTETADELIVNGIYIFLDNLLGELNFATAIDNLFVVAKEDAPAELIAVSKLKAYLVWREKEFVEKYEGLRRNPSADEYESLEGTLDSGMPVLAVINTSLMSWDAKASHPWLLTITIDYPADPTTGFANDADFRKMDELEDQLDALLPAHEGYLNIGRETGGGQRQIFVACREFRKPARVLSALTSAYLPWLQVSYDLYKDKYWRAVAHLAATDDPDDQISH